MINETPLVSIVLPTYNRAHLIGESIQSVINQTYANWELIIVDDGSTDNTTDVISEFEDIRIHYHHIEHNGLVGAVRNHGMHKASGEYIAFFDSDDLWKKNKLDFQLDLLNRYPEAVFILSNAEIFGSSSTIPPECEALFVGSLFWPILEGNRFVFYTPSLMLKKEAIDRLGLLNEKLGGTDMEFFLKMSNAYTGIFTNERLIKIRKHDQNTSDKYRIDRYLSIIKIVDDFYKKGSLQRDQYLDRVSLYYYKMGLSYFKNSQPQNALSAFWNYIKFSPLHWKGWIRLAQAACSTFSKKLLNKGAATS